MVGHDTELAVKSLMIAALSSTCKVRVSHAMTQKWQVILSLWLYSVDMQGLGVACHDTELAGNYLTVAVVSRTGKVGVWHAMAQNWQVSQINKPQFACSFYTRQSKNINSILC